MPHEAGPEVCPTMLAASAEAETAYWKGFILMFSTSKSFK